MKGTNVVLFSVFLYFPLFFFNRKKQKTLGKCPEQYSPGRRPWEALVTTPSLCPQGPNLSRVWPQTSVRLDWPSLPWAQSVRAREAPKAPLLPEASPARQGMRPKPQGRPLIPLPARPGSLQTEPRSPLAGPGSGPPSAQGLWGFLSHLPDLASHGPVC